MGTNFLQPQIIFLFLDPGGSINFRFAGQVDRKEPTFTARDHFIFLVPGGSFSFLYDPDRIRAAANDPDSIQR
jgi:hypothetical protein